MRYSSGGDGIISTTAKSSSTVSFDIDGTADLGAKLQGLEAKNYLKHTAWVGPQDGMLVLDKNSYERTDAASTVRNQKWIRYEFDSCKVPKDEGAYGFLFDLRVMEKGEQAMAHWAQRHEEFALDLTQIKF